MSAIGKFTKTADGYTGSIKTLAFSTKAVILPIGRDNDRAPDWRVYSEVNGPEIGAAWSMTSRDGKTEYLSVRLDDPSFAAPLRATLFQTKGGKPDEYELIWSRAEG